jgi:hypothetical protein
MFCRLPFRTTDATYSQRSVRERGVRFVTTSSEEKLLVSTSAGSVKLEAAAGRLAATGSTNEPSEFAWSLMTP